MTAQTENPQKDINKNQIPGFTKVNMHFGLIDKPQREEINWNGEKRRAYKGVEFLHSMKIDNLDLSLGGNVFNDDGYRYLEITERKRFNLNSTYKSEKIEGLSYGLNANFLFQTTGSAIVWDGLDRAYIPLNEEITISGKISFFKNRYQITNPTYVSKDELEVAMEVFITSVEMAHFDIVV